MNTVFETVTAFLADTLLVWNHASYMSGKDCCFEQRVLVKEPLCHCDYADWSDLIFQLRTATKLELPALNDNERKKAPGAAYCTSSTWHWSESILIPSWVQEKPLTRLRRSWRKNTLKSNAKATVLERNAACPESGNDVSNGSVRSIFLTISVQVGFTSSRWLERRKWRKAWRSSCLRVRRSYLVLGLANLCSLSAPMTMIGPIGMSYWCECVLDLIHLLMS